MTKSQNMLRGLAMVPLTIAAMMIAVWYHTVLGYFAALAGGGWLLNRYWKRAFPFPGKKIT